MQGDILKQGEQLREDIDTMKKHLFTDIDHRERADKFSRDFSPNVARSRTDHHVVAQVQPDKDEVQRQARRRWEARRLARLRRRRETVRDIDTENKENVYHSKQFIQSDAGNRRKRRRVALPSSVEFNAALTSHECSNSAARLSSQLGQLFVGERSATGRPSRLWSDRGDDGSTDATLTHSTDNRRRRVRRRCVPDDVVVDGRAVAHDDTSVWSAVSRHDDDRRPPTSAVRQTPVGSARGSPILEPEVSRICSWSPGERRELREQTSSGELTGAFHSTFSYPLHSTLIAAAAACVSVDLSAVSETVVHLDAADYDLEPTASADAAPIGRESASTSADSAQHVELDVGHIRPSMDDVINDFQTDHIATGGTDRRKTALSQNSTEKSRPLLPPMFSCYAEVDRHGEVSGRTNGRVMYFPPLSTTADAASMSSAAAAAAAVINAPREQQDSEVDDEDNTPTVRDSSDNRRQVNHIDTSVEVVVGSPCNSSHDPTTRLTFSPGPDVASRLTPSCRRCLDATAASRSSHRPNRRPEHRCGSAKSTSKSGGRGTSRMARETGRCDLRHTFNGSRLVPAVGCQSLTVRNLFGAYPARQDPAVVSWDCSSTRVYQSQGQPQRRPRHPHCRCGVEGRSSVNFVDLRTVRSSGYAQRSVVPPGESGSKFRVKRCERYFDPIRKRTLVNRLKHFSGCFCDTGCGRRMRTLANV